MYISLTVSAQNSKGGKKRLKILYYTLDISIHTLCFYVKLELHKVHLMVTVQPIKTQTRTQPSYSISPNTCYHIKSNTTTIKKQEHVISGHKKCEGKTFLEIFLI